MPLTDDRHLNRTEPFPERIARRIGSVLARPWVGIALLTAPVVVFYAIVWRYAANVPYQDDFDALLGPVTELAQRPGFLKSWQILFAQDDERRIVVDRLLAYLIYLGRGEYSFRAQILLGSGLVLVPLVLFYRQLKWLDLPVAYLLPVAFFLFQFQYYRAVFWAMIPVQQIGTCAFAMTTVYLLVRGRSWSMAMALMMGLLTIFCDISGIFVVPTGAVLLLLQRRFQRLVVWLISLGPVLVLYFYKFEVPAYRPSMAANLRDYPLTLLGQLFAFLGLAADPGKSFPLSFRVAATLIAGSLVFGCFLYFLLTVAAVKKWLPGRFLRYNRLSALLSTSWRNVWFILGSGLFIFFTTGAFALGRASEGIEAVFTDRYGLFGAVLLCLAYLTALVTAPRRRTVVLAVAAILAVGLNGRILFDYFAEIKTFRRTLQVDAYSWQRVRTLPSSAIYLAFRRQVDSIIVRSLDKDVYSFSDAFYQSLENGTVPVRTATDSLVVTDHGGQLSVRLERARPGRGPDGGPYLVMQSARQTHLFPLNLPRGSIRSILKSGRYYAEKAESPLIVKESMESGRYRLSLLQVDGGRAVLYRTSQWITVESKPAGAGLKKG